MKAYTDVEQSKKLAEILPSESADMSYVLDLDTWEYHVDLGRFSQWIVPKYAETKMPRILPCWSLAALIETMPEILIERVKAQDGYNGYYYFVTYEELIKVPYKKELIDACVEMIIKLHEEKLL